MYLTVLVYKVEEENNKSVNSPNWSLTPKVIQGKYKYKICNFDLI